jgi:membrane protein implicated in regulation of membrane protease activity
MESIGWLWGNKEWLFSGAGIAVISAVIALVWRRGASRQSQTSGANSTNIQAGRDVSVRDREPRSDDRT